MKRAILRVAVIDLIAITLGLICMVIMNHNYANKTGFKSLDVFLLVGIINLIIGIPTVVIGSIVKSNEIEYAFALIICGGLLLLLSLAVFGLIYAGL